MSTYNFRYLCGLTVLVTHVAAILMIATATRFVDIKDQIGSILIISPITLIYASRFVKYVVDNTGSRSKDTEQFDLMPALVMYFVVLIFCGSLMFVVLRFVYFSAYLVNEFKMWLGASETAFGALIALVFERLFGQEAPTRNVAPAASANIPELR